jgi:hypothetical protein
MVDVLTEWLFAVVNDLAGIVICDLLKVVVIVSVDDSLSVNMLRTTSGEVRHRQVLDIWFLLPRAFCLQAHSISYDE